MARRVIRMPSSPCSTCTYTRSSFIFSSVNEHLKAVFLQDNPSIKAIAEYILSKSAGDPSLHNKLQAILSHDAPSHLGFVFSERLVNMPVEVIPHMYRMLADEIQWACDDGEPYHFGHFLVLSRTYTLPDEEAEATSTSPQQQKRRKGASTPSAAGRVFPFHHEDTCVQEVCHAFAHAFVQRVGIELYRKVASYCLDYPLSNTLPREKENFGLEQGGRLMLFDAQKLPTLILNLAAAFPQPSP
jgi:protein BCP1